jgi:nicotinate-nucleotide adenylyltransferase
VVERLGPPYTIATLRALTAADRELFLIVGADVAAGIGTWHEADAVWKTAHIVVVSRGAEVMDEHEPVETTGALTVVPIPRLDVSSSDLRDRMTRGEPIDVLVPAGAVRVIRERRLYTRT